MQEAYSTDIKVSHSQLIAWCCNYPRFHYTRIEIKQEERRFTKKILSQLNQISRIEYYKL